MPRPTVRRVRARLWLFVLWAAPLAGCDSANPSHKGTPSPLPYGYKEPASRSAKPPSRVEGQEMDEIVAVVYGEVLTRRRLIRETGGRKPGQDDASFEKSLRIKTLQWSRQELFIRAAEQSGLHIPAAALDEAVRRRKEQEIASLSKNTGRPVTWDEYLAQEHTSDEEFRARVKNEELKRAFLRLQFVGFGKQARPQVEMTVSPAEVRRLYREEPKAFDKPQAVAYAFFLLRFVDAMTGDRTPVEAEADSKARAEQIAAAFRAGEAPAAIAQRFRLDERSWKVEENAVPQLPLQGAEEVSKWALAPERRVREARVFVLEGLPGPLVLGLLKVERAQKVTFEEAYPLVENAYQAGREIRLENLKVIEMVQGGAVAWPPSLADALVEDARETLQKLDQDPVLSRARFR